jgi:hypothetical protein
MLLPGGLHIAGERRRDFRFRPITGALELMLGESAQHAGSHAARVTTVLCQALETLGGAPATIEAVRQLSVGDRQFLMARLAAHLHDLPVWLTTHCNHCQAPFDMSYRHADLPVKMAGEEYPQVRLETSLGAVEVHVPTGADQEHIANTRDDVEAMHELLRCIVSGVDSDTAFNPQDLRAQDIAEIEQRVEAMAPEIATELLAQCPHCSRDNIVPINLYTCLARPVDELFAEIHAIASRYHWNERAILSMPHQRRQIYLRHIDSSRGMFGPSDMLQAT